MYWNAPFYALTTTGEIPGRQDTNITVPVVSAIIGHDVLVLTLLHHCYLLLDRGDVITLIRSEKMRERVYTE